MKQSKVPLFWVLLAIGGAAWAVLHSKHHTYAESYLFLVWCVAASALSTAVDGNWRTWRSIHRRVMRRGWLTQRPYSKFTTANDEVVHSRDLAPANFDAEFLDRFTADVMTVRADVRRLGVRIEKAAQLTGGKASAITILVDNSGSMRGRPIYIAASVVAGLAAELEAAGCAVAILGFTTVSWKGGKSREDWWKAGGPLRPGRLCDIRHIIYKEEDEPIGSDLSAFHLMLRESILKENVDGEALEWACQRLESRPERRRIMVIVSDGAPVDDSTLNENELVILDRHLRQVIAEIENRSPVELIAIGIGHDVTRYYKSAIAISDPSELAGAITDKLVELFSKS